jgi:GMP synthase-like glutamine amidotransferase
MTPTTIDLGILETGANRPELLGEFGTFADWFKALFAKSGAGLQATDYQCYLGRLPASTHAHNAYLITGSPASVNDPEAWISDLIAFVREAAPARPIIGVCFGHQLLHKAFGGTVMANPDGGWGVGIHDYRIIAPALLSAPSPATAQPAEL